MTKNEHCLKLCLEGQLGPPVSDENLHFLKLCPEGQLGPPISDEKVTENEHFLMGTPLSVTKNIRWDPPLVKMSTFSSCVKKVSWEPPVSDNRMSAKKDYMISEL